MSKFQPYGVGEKIAAANLTILSAKVGPHKINTYYGVRYACCGHEEQLTHLQIADRARKGLEAQTLGGKDPAKKKCHACYRNGSWKKKEAQREELARSKEATWREKWRPWYHGWVPTAAGMERLRGWMPR